jgi:hypothetical protein
MPATLTPPGQVRILSRRSARHKVTVSIRPVRPSLLDLRLRGDPWIVGHRNQTAGLYFDGTEVHGLAALQLDLPALNGQLFAMRHRLPRR